VRHRRAYRLDQGANFGTVGCILVYGLDNQSTELMLPPIVQDGRRQRAGESDHHHRPNLLPQCQPCRPGYRIFIADRLSAGGGRRLRSTGCYYDVARGQRRREAATYGRARAAADQERGKQNVDETTHAGGILLRSDLEFPLSASV
jgi:hypothetical protein